MAFDHMFDHFTKYSLISYPGVAQLVGRLIWVTYSICSMVPYPTRISIATLALFLFTLFSK